MKALCPYSEMGADPTETPSPITQSPVAVSPTRQLSIGCLSVYATTPALQPLSRK